MSVQGYCQPGYEAVAAEFERNFDERREARRHISHRHSGVGFMLQTSERLLGPPIDAFGHNGLGGSCHGSLPGLGIGFFFAMNRLRQDRNDKRSSALTLRCTKAHVDVRDDCRPNVRCRKSCMGTTLLRGAFGDGPAIGGRKGDQHHRRVRPDIASVVHHARRDSDCISRVQDDALVATEVLDRALYEV